MNENVKKSSEAEKIKRVQRVAGWLLKGEPRFNIVQNGSKIWRISNRQVDEYIAKATEEIKNNLQLNLEYELALTRERYEALYRKAYSYIEDEKKIISNSQYLFNGIKVCLEIQREICDLIGLKETGHQLIQEMEREKQRSKPKMSEEEKAEKINELNRIFCEAKVKSLENRT